MNKLTLTDMIKLSKSGENVFWTERKKNFVKLCFLFSPEKDEDLKNLDRELKIVYRSIENEFLMSNYKIYCISKDKKQILVSLKTIFDFDGFIKILIPKGENISEYDLAQLLIECSFGKIYRSFYSKELTNLQESLRDALIFTHTYLNRCRAFTSCPIEIDSYNLDVYSVDIYGRGVENLNWKF